jgi:tetratricopeptide (TPR) repeat protein
MMNTNEINNLTQRCASFLSKEKIKDAHNILHVFEKFVQNIEIRNQLEKNDEVYKNLLRFTIQGYNDPDKEKILKKIIRSDFELLDRGRNAALLKAGGVYYKSLKEKIDQRPLLTKKQAEKEINELIVNPELDALLQNTNLSGGESEKIREEKLSDLFKYIWLKDKFAENDLYLFQMLFEEENIPWNDKSILVSGLLLSTLRFFDLQKFNLFLVIISNNQEEVRERALISFILLLFYYNERLQFFPEIMDGFNKLQIDEKEILDIYLQILKSQDTEKITRKIKDEILPEMMKVGNKLKDKLDLDNIVPGEEMDDENPKWHSFIEESPELYDKLEEFSKLQMDGSDVFMGAFANLKNFDFFKDIKNWFVPFYKENEVLHENVNDKNYDKFLSSLQEAFFICNSDKYSFCLNAKQIPEQQRKMMMDMFNMEITSMLDAAKGDLETNNQKEKQKQIVTRYIQDIYRFYKLFPLKSHFEDPFKEHINLYKTSVFNELIKDKENIRLLADFYFENKHFEHAKSIYLDMLSEENSQELLERLAFCYQKLGNIQKALDYYLKADFFDSNKLWVTKKIAYCYRLLRDYDHALKYYLEAEKLDPENLALQANIGHCYFDIKDYGKALKYYFKVEYLAPNNIKVLRPIAWCLFATGKLDDSTTYYRKVPEESKSHHDMINMGHIEWCKGNLNQAIDNYKFAIQTKNISLKEFLLTLKEDIPFLKANSARLSDIQLLIDHLQYQLES